MQQTETVVRTGRRLNPTVDGPRDQTVCFMLSAGEKLALDRLAFCKQITRSGLTADVIATFVDATSGSKHGKQAEARLLALLSECRKAVEERGDLAERMVPADGGKQK